MARTTEARRIRLELLNQYEHDCYQVYEFDSSEEVLMTTLRNAYQVYCQLLDIAEFQLLSQTHKKESREELDREEALMSLQEQELEIRQSRRDELYAKYNHINDDYWDTDDGLPPDYYQDELVVGDLERQEVEHRKALQNTYDKLIEMGVVSADVQHPDEALPRRPESQPNNNSPDYPDDIPF